VVSSAGTASAQIDTGYGNLPVFEFHSGFWLNLHHTLYQEARKRTPGARSEKGARSSSLAAKVLSDPSTPLTDAERRAWDDAVSYYAANLAGKDLLFAGELVQLKEQLGDFEDCIDLSGSKQKFCNAGLDPRLTKVLEAAAPVYRARLWPEHDKANRRWVFGVAPLVRSQGIGLSQRLADIYQTQWPRHKIRVDITAYANWAGAYTTVDPLRVTISSTDPRNQGSGALEVLFHEASHGIAEPVEAAIIRECRQRDKAIPRDLWHALVFYTTGEVIRPIVGSGAPPQSGSGNDSPNVPYQPYAMREGLYQRGWDQYLKLLSTFWQPYLDGQATFDDAVARMVSAL
jgi:GNAT superfamily N-acetyltransferase